MSRRGDANDDPAYIERIGDTQTRARALRLIWGASSFPSPGRFGGGTFCRARPADRRFWRQPASLMPVSRGRMPGMQRHSDPADPAVDASWTQPDAPSGTNGNGTEPSTAWCSRCELEVTSSGKGQCPQCGVWLPKNEGALVHGARSRGYLDRLEEEAAEALREREEAIQSDLGGRDTLSTLALDTIQHYIVAEALLEDMEMRLLALGATSSKGRRRALHAAYVAQLDRTTRLGALLGLEREPQEVWS